jgi:hypothetical protein
MISLPSSIFALEFSGGEHSFGRPCRSIVVAPAVEATSTKKVKSLLVGGWEGDPSSFRMG